MLGFALSLLASATTQEPPPRDQLEPGCSFRVFESAEPLERVFEPQPDQSPNVDERRPNVNCTSDEDFGGLLDQFIVEVTAWVDAPEPGIYTFRTTSDDGSWLEVAGERILWNSGIHGPQPRDGEIELEAGLHPLRLLMFEALGGVYLTLEWRPPGAAEFELVPESVLFTEANVTRVVSPGPKVFLDQLGDMSPGDGLPLEAVHPGWRVEPLRPEGFEPQVGGLAWLPDGRLGVLSFEPKNDATADLTPAGVLYAMSGLADPAGIEVATVAEGLSLPLGIEVVGGEVFVAEREAITRLVDGDGDGVFESREVFASGWKSDNYHHFTFGPVAGNGPDGKCLYAALSTSIGAGGEDPRSGSVIGSNGPNPEHRGSWMRISLDSELGPEQRVEYLAGGFRTPNGLLPRGDGTALVADNQGAWKPANRIDHARPGRFYGHYNETRVLTELYPEGGAPALFAEQPPSGPAIWLPQNESNSSPTEMLEVPDGLFEGQILIGELKQGGIRRACLEEVDGTLQGTVFRFTQGFEGGVNRLLWDADGSLIVGMTGETATWSWRGTTFGLQRLAPTGATAFELLKVDVEQQGLRVHFTQPANAEQLAQGGRFQAVQWGYRATAEYGGSKRDVEPLEVVAADVAEDGRSVLLQLDELKQDRVVHLRFDLQSANGEPLWSPECWTTVNRIPGRTRATSEHPVLGRRELPWPSDGGAVLVFSKTAGYRHGSIPDGIAALEALCAELELECVASEDAELFEDRSLSQFRAVVFLSTTGDVLDLAQEAAFQRYIEAGGGFLGVHASADTEYDWHWYRELTGALFSRHPAVQPADVEVLDRSHPSTAHLPEVWRRTDEWYDYRTLPGDEFHVLLRLDESSYEGGEMTAALGSHPIAWARELAPEAGAARMLYTGGGHTSVAFTEPLFVAHLRGALGWVARQGLPD